MPCKNKLGVLYFVVASFTCLLWVSSKNRSYLRKITTVIHQVCCFNLLQGPAIVKFNSTKVGETDTRQPPLCKTSCMSVCRWNRSHKRVMQGWSGPLHSTIPPNQNKTLVVRSMNITAHNSFVFYSCISSTHRPGSDATVGERCTENNKILHTRKIYPWRCIAMRWERVSMYPRRP